MTTQFFLGQVRLLLKRCDFLHEHLNNIKNKLPKEIKSYIVEVETELEKLSNDLNKLIQDEYFGKPYLLKNQINEYRRYAEKANLLESYPLVTLDQFNNRDYYLYRFAKLLCSQVSYPYKTPLVSTHSSDYFYVAPNIDIINIPLCEHDFLLAIPDFVHELGHFFYDYNYYHIENHFETIVNKYIQQEKSKARNDNLSASYQRKFDLLKKVWMQEYIIEFSCDIFATYLVGIAYAWSNLRLILESTDKIYTPGFGKDSTHPADEARMRAILITIEELQGSKSTETIAKKWEDFKCQIFAQQQEMEYDYCYPNSLLRELVKILINICQSNNLIPYYQQPQTDNNLSWMMQQAWMKFHEDPQAYPEWETQKIEQIKSKINQK